MIAERFTTSKRVKPYAPFAGAGRENKAAVMKKPAPESSTTMAIGELDTDPLGASDDIRWNVEAKLREAFPTLSEQRIDVIVDGIIDHLPAVLLAAELQNKHLSYIRVDGSTGAVTFLLTGRYRYREENDQFTMPESGEGATQKERTPEKALDTGSGSEALGACRA